MFVNISNHPHEKWGDEQKQAAFDMGNDIIGDIPFPNVDPNFTSKKVKKLASDIYAKFLNMTSSEVYPHFAMVQGESTLCHFLVKRLLQNGFGVVVACSQRVVTENPDGSKTAQFQFVHFRDLY